MVKRSERRKQEKLKKQKGQNQNIEEVEIGKDQTIFQLKFFDGDMNQKEKGLIMIASISLSNQIPYQSFYEEKMIQKLFDLANQLENKLSYLSLDALRNLIVQAFLMEKLELYELIIKKGYLNLVQQIIDKAIQMLVYENKLNAKQQNQQNQELYKLVIEQAYQNLSDLFHFAEEGKMLTFLAQSKTVSKAIQILYNYQQYGYILTIRIFNRISHFLKEAFVADTYLIELSQQGVLQQQELSLIDKLKQFILERSLQINNENMEFCINILYFYLNLSIAKKHYDPSFLKQLFQVLLFILNSTDTPQNKFMKDLSSQYKLADAKDMQGGDNGDDEEDEEEEEESKEMQEENNQQLKSKQKTKQQEMQDNDNNDEEESNEANNKLQQSLIYKQWKVIGRANISCLELIQTVFDNLSNNVEEDDEYEELDEDDQQMIEGEEEEQKNESNNSILKIFSQELIQSGLVNQIIQRCKPIPQHIGLQRDIEEILESLQLEGFQLMMTLYQQRDILSQLNFEELLLVIKEQFEQNLSSCEELYYDYIQQLLIQIISEKKEIKQWIQQNLLNEIVRAGSYVQNFETKGIIIQILSCLLSTSETQNNKKEEFMIINAELNAKVCDILISSCKTQDLMLITHALNGFYDIYSENYYDQVLKDEKVMELMQQGLPFLQNLYAQEKKQKLLSKVDISYASDALENLPRFIEYKLQEFKKQ